MSAHSIIGAKSGGFTFRQTMQKGTYVKTHSRIYQMKWKFHPSSGYRCCPCASSFKGLLAAVTNQSATIAVVTSSLDMVTFRMPTPTHRLISWFLCMVRIFTLHKLEVNLRDILSTVSNS